MLIKWIRLHNIRSYTDAEVVFPNGSTLLSGDIGCGKSTILLSVEFALFGFIKGEVSGSTLLRKGETSGYVELCFNIENDEIVIKRILKKKKDGISQESGYIILNELKKDSAPVELTAKVVEKLNYPAEIISKKNMIYRYTVYTPQEEMKRIIFESSEERLNTLRKVFGVDKYKLIRENSSLVIKKLKEQCKEIEGFVSDLDLKLKFKMDMEKKKENLVKEMTPLKANLENKKKETIESENAYREKKKQYESYIRLRESFANKDSELKTLERQNADNEKLTAKLKTEIEGMKIEKADLSERDKLEKDIAEQERNIATLGEKKTNGRARLSQIKKKVSDLTTTISKNKDASSEKNALGARITGLKLEIERKESLREMLEENTKQIISIEKKIAEISVNIERSKGIINKMQKLDDCPLCLQKVNHDHKQKITSKEAEEILVNEAVLKDAVEQKAKINSEVAAAKLRIKEIEEKELRLRKFELRMNEIESIGREIASKEKELSEMHIEEEETEKELKALEGINTAELEKKLNDAKLKKKTIDNALTMQKIKEEKENSLKIISVKINSSNSRISEINIEMKSIRMEMDKLSGIDKAISEIERLVSIKKEESKLIELEIAVKNTELNSIIEELKRTSSEIKEKEERKKVLIRKNQLIEWINKSFINMIAVIEKNILGSLYQEFNALFQEWFDVLIEDELISARLDENFTPVVQQNGYETELENMSGGEKTALALAYRLALNKVINEITTEIKTRDLIILDEPTDGFSEQQLDKIRDVLERLDMKQVIIVSHESKIESFVDNVIKITKEEHVSKIA